MKKTLLLYSAFVLLTVNVSAQKQKPWTEWSEKEAVKILTDSAWAQTQKEVTDAGSAGGKSMNSSTGKNTTSNVGMSDADSNDKISQKSASLTANYNVAFLTAKPVRQAFIRYLELKSPETPADQAAQRRAFIDREFGDVIVVTLKVEGNDKGKVDPVKELLKGDSKAFKDTAYLERKDGKRVALADYRVPDQFGAKFIFPRTVEGKPFLDETSGEVRLYVDLGKTKLSRRFKVADMMYDGKLEY